MDLWGGLKENHRFAFILPFMLLAVGGFIEYWRTTLFVMDEEIVATLRYSIELMKFLFFSLSCARIFMPQVALGEIRWQWLL